MQKSFALLILSCFSKTSMPTIKERRKAWFCIFCNASVDHVTPRDTTGPSECVQESHSDLSNPYEMLCVFPLPSL